MHILLIRDAEEKAKQTLALFNQREIISIKSTAEILAPAEEALPGMPANFLLGLHNNVANRPPASLEGRAVLVHAIVHIEFNSINLALDAIWRFAGMPDAYYRDWLKVAGEEAKHFSLLNARLLKMGWHYGRFPAHQGLWSMCEKTQDDHVARMALGTSHHGSPRTGCHAVDSK